MKFPRGPSCAGPERHVPAVQRVALRTASCAVIAPGAAASAELRRAPRSASSCDVGARRSDRRITPSWMSQPFAVVQQSHAVACLERSPICARTLQSVPRSSWCCSGLSRSMLPNWMSYRARVAYTSTGNAALSSACSSCQSTWVIKSMRRLCGWEHDALLHCGAGKRALYQRTAAHGAVFFHAPARRGRPAPHVFGIVLLQVPRVVVVGTILEHLETLPRAPGFEYPRAGPRCRPNGRNAPQASSSRFHRRRGNAPPVFGDLRRKGTGAEAQPESGSAASPLAGQLRPTKHSSPSAQRKEGDGRRPARPRQALPLRHAHQRVLCKAELVEHQNVRRRLRAPARPARFCASPMSAASEASTCSYSLHGILVHLFKWRDPGRISWNWLSSVSSSCGPALRRDRHGPVPQARFKRAEQLRVGVLNSARRL